MSYGTKYSETFSFSKVADLGELSLQCAWNFNLLTYMPLPLLINFFLPQKGLMPIRELMLARLSVLGHLSI